MKDDWIVVASVGFLISLSLFTASLSDTAPAPRGLEPYLPAISEVSPKAATPGSAILILGEGFLEPDALAPVTFSGVSATISEWDDRSIVVVVPQGAITGELVVKTSLGSDEVPFTVIGPAPRPVAAEPIQPAVPAPAPAVTPAPAPAPIAPAPAEPVPQTPPEPPAAEPDEPQPDPDGPSGGDDEPSWDPYDEDERQWLPEDDEADDGFHFPWRR
ncbi:MAG: IPT/TIG domain-containing protein [Candidatus Geothermincolia bacterium]